MRTVKLTIAYDGTGYAGWQVQPDRDTVQSVLEGGIEKITGESVRVLASGRTDAGVHAAGQVVGFQTGTHLTPEVLARALNAVLPDDIAVLDASEVAAGFHPIRDAVKKRYRYTIFNRSVRDVFHRRYCWHYYAQTLDVEAMDRAAQSLRGTHDFSSFETAGAPRESSVRTISDIFVRRVSSVDPMSSDVVPAISNGDFIMIEVEADGFLYNMVRAIVGSLVEIGRGAQPESWLTEVLAATDRRRAGPTAPPEGLCLMHVDYA